MAAGQPLAAPVQAGEAKPGVPEPTPNAPRESRPAAPQAQIPQPAPQPVTSQQAAPKPVATTAPVQVPKPAAEDPAAKLARGVSLIQSDPRQAAAILRPLAYAQPGDASLQGNYLAALYRGRNVAEFERAMGNAKQNGLTALRLSQASPAFRQAYLDERAAQKARNGTSVWSVDDFVKLMR